MSLVTVSYSLQKKTLYPKNEEKEKEEHCAFELKD